MNLVNRATVAVILATSLSAIGQNASGNSNAQEGIADAPAVLPGDPRVDGSFFQTYENQWKLTVKSPKGISRDMGTWSDKLEQVDSSGRKLLKRIQLAKLPRGTSLVINVFNPKTMAPVTSDTRDVGGSDFIHRDFDGAEVTTFQMNDPPPGKVKGSTKKTDTPVFDFYGGMYGLAIAAFPLQEGFAAKIPAIGEFDDSFSWIPFRVVRQEEIAAGPNRKVNTWVVEAKTVQGPMTFWLTKAAPYIIRLVYTGPNGNTWTYEMM